MSPLSRDLARRLRAATIHFFRQGWFALVVVATGAGMGLAAVGFRELLKGANTLFFGGFHQLDLGATLLNRPYLALVPAAGGLLVGLYFRFVVHQGAGHGVSEVIVALETRQSRLSWVTGVHTAIASSVTIGSGGSAGPEGPIIQIGAALASGLGQLLRLPPNRLRTLLACGAGAGLAGMYHAPLTGAAFAAEVLLEELEPRSFSLIALATVTASAVAGQFNVERAVTVPPLPPAPWGSVPLDVLLGLIAAPFGVALLLGINRLGQFSAGVRLPSYLKPAIGGLIVGAIGLLLPRVLGTGETTIDQVLHDQIGMGLLFALPLAKLVATSITLGSGATGGVFTPSLGIGVALGGAFSIVVRHVWPGAGPEPEFALVGMGTVVAAAVNAPLTAVLLVCEFTHDFTLLPQVVAAVAASVALARRLHPESIYTLPLSMEGLDRRLFHRSPLVRVRVRDVLQSAWPVLHAGDPLSAARELAAASGHSVFPVVEPDGGLIGLLDLAAQSDRHDGEELSVGDVVESSGISAEPEQRLHDLALALGAHGMPQAVVPVVEAGTRLYLGVVEAAAILQAYSRADWPEDRLRRRAGLPVRH